jgi:hypothetical protein
MAKFEDRTGSRIWNKVKSPELERQAANRNRPDSRVVLVCAAGRPVEFGCGSWLTSRKSIRSFKVLHTPHGWRPLRVSFWKRTEPSPHLSGKDRSQLELRIADRSAVNLSIDSVSIDSGSEVRSCAGSFFYWLSLSTKGLCCLGKYRPQPACTWTITFGPSKMALPQTPRV